MQSLVRRVCWLFLSSSRLGDLHGDAVLAGLEVVFSYPSDLRVFPRAWRYRKDMQRTFVSSVSPKEVLLVTLEIILVPVRWLLGLVSNNI